MGVTPVKCVIVWPASSDPCLRSVIVCVQFSLPMPWAIGQIHWTPRSALCGACTGVPDPFTIQRAYYAHTISTRDASAARHEEKRSKSVTFLFLGRRELRAHLARAHAPIPRIKVTLHDLGAWHVIEQGRELATAVATSACAARIPQIQCKPDLQISYIRACHPPRCLAGEPRGEGGGSTRTRDSTADTRPISSPRLRTRTGTRIASPPLTARSKKSST